MSIPIPTVLSPRLRLRAPTAADFAGSLAMWRDPEVTRHITGRPSTAEEVWARLLRYLGHWTLAGYGFWAVERRDTGAYLGEVGLADYRRGIHPAMQGVPEIGWVLSRDAQGQGFATEAARAALDWRDTALPPGRTTCIIAPEHAASLRVAAKLGFAVLAQASYRGEPTTVLMRG